MSGPAFSACLEIVLREEGGYVHHPQDPGGATNMGITRKTLAAWRGVDPWWNLPKKAVRDLTRREAAEIYAARYWVPCQAQDMPSGLNLAVFDFAVHSGPRRAVKALQSVLGVAPDGIVGPVTLRAIEKLAQRGAVSHLVRELCSLRLAFLRSLPHYRQFGAGWRARVANVRAQALAQYASSQKAMPGRLPDQPKKRTNEMDIFQGYKTYIVGAMMLLTALAQIAGIAVPGFENHSAAQLLMEALGLIFMRRGIANVAKS